jgi:hypothetical protein
MTSAVAARRRIARPWATGERRAVRGSEQVRVGIGEEIRQP